ncbi:emopamil binding protein [Colletotrichum scovillei]|uniref:emopamil binding protein n=1 Tax=Colletotrichum scovillei TaxID=1209932 RepID=UPI0015C32F4D|nr:emopamil binding protein [Colletotrichum scovillei]KAF4781190.1 emopamil binding protein [Colletotrichum scovillei]
MVWPSGQHGHSTGESSGLKLRSRNQGGGSCAEAPDENGGLFRDKLGPGYFILNHKSLASDQSLFGQLWKEYALSDSRYLTSDPFMLCVESFTVLVWGPLCWAIVIATAKRNQLRYPFQIIMSVGHLYGVVLYYSTSLIELYSNGVSHSRPEFLYFWVYYIGFNAPWVVVPANRADVVAKLNRIDGIMGDKSWQTYVPKDEEKKTN